MPPQTQPVALRSGSSNILMAGQNVAVHSCANGGGCAWTGEGCAKATAPFLAATAAPIRIGAVRGSTSVGIGWTKSAALEALSSETPARFAPIGTNTRALVGASKRTLDEVQQSLSTDPNVRASLPVAYSKLTGLLQGTYSIDFAVLASAAAYLLAQSIQVRGSQPGANAIVKEALCWAFGLFCKGKPKKPKLGYSVGDATPKNGHWKFPELCVIAMMIELMMRRDIGQVKGVHFDVRIDTFMDGTCAVFISECNTPCANNECGKCLSNLCDPDSPDPVRHCKETASGQPYPCMNPKKMDPCPTGVPECCPPPKGTESPCGAGIDNIIEKVKAKLITGGMDPYSSAIAVRFKFRWAPCDPKTDPLTNSLSSGTATGIGALAAQMKAECARKDICVVCWEIGLGNGATKDYTWYPNPC